MGFLQLITTSRWPHNTPPYRLVDEAKKILANFAKLGIPHGLYSTAALQNTALPAANIAGANNVDFLNTGTTPATLTTDTAAAIVAAIPNAFAGQAYDLYIRNGSGSANTATIAGGSNVTLHGGTYTIAQNATRKFKVVLTNVTVGSEAVDMYSMGLFAAGA